MTIYLESLPSMVHFPFNHVKELELSLDPIAYVGGGLFGPRHQTGSQNSRTLSPPGGTFISGGRGGLDLASSLEAKFGARFSQVHQIRGKIWGVLSLQDAKFGKESQFWGHLGLYLKFKGKIWGIYHLYFWRQNLGLRHEFQRQNLGPSPPPPDLLIWKYPLWAFN